MSQPLDPGETGSGSTDRVADGDSSSFGDTSIPEDSPSGRVVMLSGDLMFASRVRSVAQRLGLVFYFGGNLPQDALDDVRVVVLDLGTRGGLAHTLKGQCEQRCPAAKLIAFGPHVQADKIQRAKASGIELVMTNGQFNQTMHQLFD